MTDLTPPSAPREGYRPEWLALEDASGGRYFMVGDFSIDGPAYNMIFSAMSKQWPELEDVLEIWNEKSDASCNNMDVRIYKPKLASTTSLPVMVYFHGGGYFAGNLDTEDAHCRIFAAKTPCLVISCDYEKVGNPGVNIEKVITQNGVPLVRWCRKRGSEIGADSSKTILCGGSAGAFLAAQIAYRYIEAGDTTTISGLALLFAVAFPYTYGENGKHKDKFKGWEDNGNAQVPIINRKLAEYIWSHYDADFENPRHFPGLAKDFSKWPPTYIVCAEKDCFRDDGRLLNELMEKDGVVTKLDYYEGLPHYFHFFPTLDAAREMMANSIEGVRFLLEKIQAS